MFLWGPPGIGKTTLAYVVSKATNKRFVELSAITAGVKEVRAVIDGARRAMGGHGKETVLFLDEIHRFSKAQQDSLLPAVENRWVTLIAATTENPYFSIISPLLSRSLLLTLEPLTDDDLRGLLRRALSAERGLGDAVTLPDEAEAHLLRIMRRRRPARAHRPGGGRRIGHRQGREGDHPSDPGGVGRPGRREVRPRRRPALRRRERPDQVHPRLGRGRGAALSGPHDRGGRGPRFIARRLMISASEDIGLADPTALPTAVAAAQAVAMIGFPEAALTLSHATIALALAPKSNAATIAIQQAQADVRAGLAGPVPPHLRDGHYKGAAKLGHAQGYVYPHDVPGGIAAQQYAPDAIEGKRYYQPTRYGGEARYADVVERVRARLKGSSPRPSQVPGPAAEALAPTRYTCPQCCVPCPVSYRHHQNGTSSRSPGPHGPGISRSVAHRRRCRGQPTTISYSGKRSVGHSRAARMCPDQGAAARRIQIHRIRWVSQAADCDLP